MLPIIPHYYLQSIVAGHFAKIWAGSFSVRGQAHKARVFSQGVKKNTNKQKAKTSTKHKKVEHKRVKV